MIDAIHVCLLDISLRVNQVNLGLLELMEELVQLGDRFVHHTSYYTMYIGRNDVVIWNDFLNICLWGSFVANWNTSSENWSSENLKASFEDLESFL